MAIHVLIQSTVQAEKLNALRPFLEKNLPAVRGFQGCWQVSIMLNKTDGDMVFQEVWQSRQHHEDYLAHIDSNGVMAELASLLSQAPTIRYFDALYI